ncbi:MAG: lantibiotic biosynthesis protein [Actinomycetota bacterium]|jgi:thiopeptide-type bacteriocin biosynthesis protein
MTEANDEFRASGGCVVRAPVLPLRIVAQLSDGLTGDAAADLVIVDGRLRALVSDPVVREALFLASPSLDDRLDAWLAGKDDERTTRSVLSYVTRMAARSTPFGLFAGCVAGTVGDGETRLTLGGRAQLRRHTRLDFDYLARLVTDLEQNESTRGALRFVPNTSLYTAGGRLRLAEGRYDGNALRYRRVAIEDDEYLAATLARARDGATLAELAAALVDDEITVEEATEYVGELVASQVLVSELGPAVTGDEPTRALAAALRSDPATKHVGELLDGAQDALDRLDAAGVGDAPAEFRAIASSLEGAGTRVDMARLFQADLVLGGSDVHVGASLLEELRVAVRALHRLHPPASGDSELARFKSAFAARYEGAEVPLLEALDEEVGVGLGSTGSSADGQPLLPGPVIQGGGDGGMRVSASDLALMEMVVACARNGDAVLHLDDAALERLARRDAPPLPDAFAVHASLLDGDGTVYVFHASGPPGARMLGRFCHADPDLDALVRRHVAEEEALAADAHFFEIVHLPEGRIGNVLCRPVLRDYEVEYLGRSGALRERVLPATDLLVSLDGDRIRLRSATLGCELIPRNTTAHNLRSSRIALYRFLGALQGDGRAEAMSWRWGHLDALPFLPRVTVGTRAVLARARWRVRGDDLKELRDAVDPAARLAATRALAQRHGIPRWVALAEADHEIVVDLDAVTGAELVAFEAKRAPELTLVEVVGLDGAATSVDGAHAAEVIVPMVRTTPLPPAALPARANAPKVRRVFVPGEEWLSLKLYCGAATVDAVLREVVAPCVAATVEGAADRWFFLRYGDPDWHIRLRFHGEPERLTSEVLPALHASAAPLLADGRLHSIVADTYRREVERYGGPAGIEVFETISAADSDAALAIVGLTPGDDGLRQRWLYTALGLDRLLADLAIEVADRQRLVRQWRDGLASDIGASWTVHAGAVHRKDGRTLAALLEAQAGPAHAVFATRSAAVAPAVAALRDAEARGLLSESVERIAGSYTHMHANRMLRGAARVQELVLYDLLDRWYRRLASRS